jgi:uncharacterized protein YjbJ (UPF0337 family)
MTDRSGPKDAAQGLAEGIKGKVKELWARVTGDRKLSREAEAQQDKGAAQRLAAREEAEAERARTEAAVHDLEQRSEQDG